MLIIIYIKYKLIIFKYIYNKLNITNLINNLMVGNY